MRSEYDMRKAKRGPVIKESSKTRITIMLDNDILEEFRDRARGTGRGYQTEINHALRNYLQTEGFVETLRDVIREEFLPELRGSVIKVSSERSRAKNGRAKSAKKAVGSKRKKVGA